MKFFPRNDDFNDKPAAFLRADFYDSRLSEIYDEKLSSLAQHAIAWTKP
jgi:hypothetical protein